MLYRSIRSIIKCMLRICRKFVLKNYDYCFLKNKIKRIEKDKDKQIIVAGISYSLFGIDERLLKYNASNLSLASQDLYYSYKIVQRVIEKNKNIKYCIIGSSYYGFHFDLSSSKNENYRVNNVYYPILGDIHNCTSCNTNLENYASRFRFNMLAIFSSSYFNFIRTRDSMGLIKSKLKKLSENELKEIGQSRASTHNKLLKYRHTLNENLKILDDFLNLLQSNDVKPLIVVFPATDYYRCYFKEDFKKIFYDIINIMYDKYKFELIDLFDSSEFCLDDFVDFDHLNEKGSRKVTHIINSYL